MFEDGDPEHVHDSGGKESGMSEDNLQGRGPGEIGGQDGEGTGAAAATPPVGEDTAKGQTEHPAPEDDVSVPSHEEIAEEEREAGGDPSE